MLKHERPNEFDAVLGNQGVVTQGSMILGGVEGLKQRLNSHSLQVKIAALEEAVNYGTAGLQVLLAYLDDRDLQIQNRVYELLESRSEPFVIEHLANNGIRRYTRHKNRFDLFEQMGKRGTTADVDIMMESLECDPHSSPYKLIDYTLGLVNRSTGKERIEYYLFNGTQVQRNYAALYFKRLGEMGILTEAVRMGCIDRVQAFSK
ncbi:GUN4 N-terminal ARM-like repeat domain-containing protein [Chamaesiphon minutus]|uniref:GUN4 N-terminal ARM-like repeat domain-containing protein n=1 Tax=Chamaesiphon minutus (strain ATCC 27169 / PCC 6605) TaxID=1173020 RepID=K9UB31_CHAP6|nr:GUN4 N-terminal ARM-like repeat domain-containing protein [Chamaesiphon minutus]AFY92292.1 hypothetical protein Cha6605_1059 [Chamaesiphon minutus PCC 6605]